MPRSAAPYRYSNLTIRFTTVTTHFSIILVSASPLDLLLISIKPPIRPHHLSKRQPHRRLRPLIRRPRPVPLSHIRIHIPGTTTRHPLSTRLICKRPALLTAYAALGNPASFSLPSSTAAWNSRMMASMSACVFEASKRARSSGEYFDKAPAVLATLVRRPEGRRRERNARDAERVL
jgi:hypothetical protein